MKIHIDSRIARRGHGRLSSFAVSNHWRIIPPLPAGEGRGEGESFEREYHRLTENPSTLRNRNEGGFVATVLFISLLAIMLMLATAGGMALIRLHIEVKALQRQQINRLDLSVTNSVAISHMNITKVDLK